MGHWAPEHRPFTVCMESSQRGWCGCWHVYSGQRGFSDTSKQTYQEQDLAGVDFPTITPLFSFWLSRSSLNLLSMSTSTAWARRCPIAKFSSPEIMNSLFSTVETLPPPLDIYFWPFICLIMQTYSISNHKAIATIMTCWKTELMVSCVIVSCFWGRGYKWVWAFSQFIGQCETLGGSVSTVCTNSRWNPTDGQF